MFAGVADDSRFSMMFNTYTMSENAKYSPGLILMRTIIDAYAERGVTSLDLGIGGDDYKRMFCKDDEPIFDSFVPLTTRGRLGAMGLSSFAHAKRIVKQTPSPAADGADAAPRVSAVTNTFSSAIETTSCPGLTPGIHVLVVALRRRRGWPGQARP